MLNFWSIFPNEKCCNLGQIQHILQFEKYFQMKNISWSINTVLALELQHSIIKFKQKRNRRKRETMSISLRFIVAGLILFFVSRYATCNFFLKVLDIYLPYIYIYIYIYIYMYMTISYV